VADLVDSGRPPPDIDIQRADPAILDRLDTWSRHELGDRP
jgi:hypothetical protein